MKKMNRRTIFKAGALACLSGLALKSEIFIKSAAAKAIRILDPKSKTAQRLEYVVKASESKNKKYEKGQNCANCMHYKTPQGDKGKCAMAAMMYVQAAGWCKQYKAKKA